MHPHAPVRSAELPPLFQRGGEATRRATLGRVGEAARPQWRRARVLEPVRNPGSGQPPAAEGEGEWAAPNPSRLGKGEGVRQCDRGGREGSGKQRATPAAEGEAPLPLCTQPKPPPLPARLRLPPLPVHGAWELHTYELRVWRGELGKREGVGVGRETAAMAHSACSPTRPAPDLEKKNSP